ncbi:unnamed protein product [Ectocarpus sp. 12 AP-2014]
MESKVLVVGAGLAGLSAARELSHRGYDVIVLEATSRVGGRLLSAQVAETGGAAIDLGAAFIHGIEDNPVAALAQELGLTLVPMDDCTLLGNDGQPVPEAMDQRIQRLWNRVLDECAEKQKNSNKKNNNTLPPSGMGSAGDDSRGETSEESHGEGSSGAESEPMEHEGTNRDHAQAPDEDGTHKAVPIDAAQESKGPVGSGRAGGSVGRVVLQRPAHGTDSTAPASLGKVLEETARVHLASFSKSEMEVWDWHRGNLEISCGADLNELDHLHWNQDDEYDFDGDHVIIKEGYAALSSRVAATLDIRLNTEVKMIRLDDAQSNVEVLVNSEGKDTTLRAGYVVVTLPLGVLKARLVRFKPALQDSKLAAIRSMGMGTLNKLVLHFPRVFWDQVDFLGHAGKDRRKWLLFMDMSRVTGRPILVAMSGGPFAVLVERLGDAEITRRAMDVIRRIYPNAPDPVSSQATRWKTSKFSRGSFSFIPPGCSAEEYDALAEPISDRRGKPRVLFAGEHTTKYHPSTVHGAWLTGLREATRLDSHARAGWHRKGKRDDNFSPDIMYETSVLFDPTRVARRPRKGVRRGARKVRIRPSKQSDGTDCRRSPRIGVGHGEQHGKRSRSEGSTTSDRFRNTDERQKRSLSRPVRDSGRQERQDYFAGGVA